MKNPDLSQLATTRVLFLSHGGGPLPLLGDAGHAEMVDSLNALSTVLAKPEAIVLISAHWEAPVITLTAQGQPPLLYDYYGFPEASYHIQYPAQGKPELAQQITQHLSAQGLTAATTLSRGFDHGMFIPLKILFPEADVPCVQMSLHNNLDAAGHIALGRALQSLTRQNILVIGSGFTFHNMSAFFDPPQDVANAHNHIFHEWLEQTMTEPGLSEQERTARLAHWQSAPHARFCHPREEHLLPLHLCFGAAGCTPAKHYLEMNIINKRTHFYFW